MKSVQPFGIVPIAPFRPLCYHRETTYGSQAAQTPFTILASDLVPHPLLDYFAEPSKTFFLLLYVRTCSSKNAMSCCKHLSTE